MITEYKIFEKYYNKKEIIKLIETIILFGSDQYYILKNDLNIDHDIIYNNEDYSNITSLYSNFLVYNSYVNDSMTTQDGEYEKVKKDDLLIILNAFKNSDDYEFVQFKNANIDDMYSWHYKNYIEMLGFIDELNYNNYPETYDDYLISQNMEKFNI